MDAARKWQRCLPVRCVQRGPPPTPPPPSPAPNSRKGNGPAADGGLELRLTAGQVALRLHAACTAALSRAVPHQKLSPETNRAAAKRQHASRQGAAAAGQQRRQAGAHQADDVAGLVDDEAPQLAGLVKPAVAGVGAASGVGGGGSAGWAGGAGRAGHDSGAPSVLVSCQARQRWHPRPCQEDS